MVNEGDSLQLYLALFLGAFSGALLVWAFMLGTPRFLNRRRWKINERKLAIEKERSALEEELRRLTNLKSTLNAFQAIDTHKTEEVATTSDAGKAVDKERLRIAHELHDDIVQRIAAVRLRVEEFSYRLDRPELVEVITALSEEMNLIMKSLRYVIYGLPQPQFEKGSFSELIKNHLVARLNRVAAKTVEFQLENEQREFLLPIAVKRELYNLVQEAIQNSLKHSTGFRLKLSVIWTAMLEIEVADNGQGYIPQSGAVPGLGIASMEERARAIGAKLSLIPSSYGSVVKITVPDHFSK